MGYNYHTYVVIGLERPMAGCTEMTVDIMALENANCLFFYAAV
ncbi:hypothetical protein DSUL_40033 [Desulfovibrionales bacterium]